MDNTSPFFITFAIAMYRVTPSTGNLQTVKDLLSEFLASGEIVPPPIAKFALEELSNEAPFTLPKRRGNRKDAESRLEDSRLAGLIAEKKEATGLPLTGGRKDGVYDLLSDITGIDSGTLEQSRRNTLEDMKMFAQEVRNIIGETFNTDEHYATLIVMDIPDTLTDLILGKK